MADRVLKVNAYTTLDLVDATAEGHDFEESAYATLNATAARNDPDSVALQLELDNTELDALPTHADKVDLSPEQARTLAADLKKHAERVEQAQNRTDADETEPRATADDD
ncbi:DUF6360 family protein [Halorussus salinus]|uniref:DUF6360 family protein n=1 Tax=Halorussus salinus TaxID=1364935 RepID=UPI001091CE38|nr:DUF6360 family protein [Halorussus salinus]